MPTTLRRRRHPDHQKAQRDVRLIAQVARYSRSRPRYHSSRVWTPSVDLAISTLVSITALVTVITHHGAAPTKDLLHRASSSSTPKASGDKRQPLSAYLRHLYCFPTARNTDGLYYENLNMTFNIKLRLPWLQSPERAFRSRPDHHPYFGHSQKQQHFQRGSATYLVVTVRAQCFSQRWPRTVETLRPKHLFTYFV